MRWERPTGLLPLLLCSWLSLSLFVGRVQAQTGVIATIAGSTVLNSAPLRGFAGDDGLARKALFALANFQNECDPNRFEQISHIAVDPSGGLSIADSGNQRIRRVSLSAVVTTLAGTGEPPVLDPRTCAPTGAIGDGGAATAARMYNPAGVAYGPGGALIVADQQNNRIRRVSADGLIATIAGNGLHAFYAPGIPALSSGMDWPTAVAVDRSGVVYFSELHSGRVARIGPDGRLITVAGSGIPGFNGDSGPATSMRLSNPTGIALDAAGNLYIADQGNHRVRKVTPDGQLRTIAGSRQGFAGDGGPASDALLDRPADVKVDGAGNIYVSDMNNHRVRRIDLSGAIDTVAGDGAPVRGADGVPAVSSSLNLPTGLAVDANDDVFVVDWGNCLIRKIIFSGQPVIASNGLGSSASFLPGPIASGSLLTIIGVNLAPSAAEADAAAWPAELNGVSVRLNGEPIPLQFVSPAQINGQIPQSIPVGEVSVVVTTPAGASSPEFLSIVDPAVAMLLQPGSVRRAQLRVLIPGNVTPGPETTRAFRSGNQPGNVAAVSDQ